ncbi:MAG: YncE family protein [Thermoplasmata archaeon]
MVPAGPALSLAYDWGKGEVFVAGGGCQSSPHESALRIISDATDRVIGSVPLGCDAREVVYDPGMGEVFVSNFSNSIAVVSDATNTVVSTISVPGGALGMAYDSAKREIFVTGLAPNATVISDISNSVVAEIPIGPAGTFMNGSQPAYDALGEVFVPDPSEHYVSVINDTTDAVVAQVLDFGDPTGAVWDPGTDQVFVADLDSSDVAGISCANNRVVTTVPGPTPYGLAYDPSLGEVFAGSYTWSDSPVIAISDSTDTIAGSWYVGPNVLSVTYDSGSDQIFAASSLNRNVSVLGSGYNTTFVESGLPAGTNWSVEMNGHAIWSNLSSLTFVEGNGKYEFSIGPQGRYSASPDEGRVKVSGAALTVDIVFARAFYAVSFTETGLPLGTNWTVLLGGRLAYSLNASNVFPEPNGSYPFSISPVDNYYLDPPGGNLTVQGGPLSLTVFADFTSPVTFSESGLPLGATWSVQLNGNDQSSVGESIRYVEPNGTYWFTVKGSRGFTPTPASGFVTVNGLGASWGINFSAPPPSVTVPPGQGLLGLPGYGGLFLIVWDAALSAVVLAVVVLRTRKTLPPAPPQLSLGQ